MPSVQKAALISPGASWTTGTTRCADVPSRSGSAARDRYRRAARREAVSAADGRGDHGDCLVDARTVRIDDELSKGLLARPRQPRARRGHDDAERVDRIDPVRSPRGA